MNRPLDDPSDLRPIRESEVLQPSRMIAMGDAILLNEPTPPSVAQSQTGDPKGYFGFDNLAWGIVAPGYIQMDWIQRKQMKRHQGRWNVLFGDTHVQNMKYRELFDYKSDEVRRLWNKDHEPHREFPPEFR